MASPATAADSLFTFYDIESLSNVFSISAYTPRHASGPHLDVFARIDDEELASRMDPAGLDKAIRDANPGLPVSTTIAFRDLSTAAEIRGLAGMLGLADSRPVGDRSQRSSYPADLRPVCDTDPEYDPGVHPFLAGYNSFNYDTTMLALYLDKAFVTTVWKAREIALIENEITAARRRAAKNHARQSDTAAAGESLEALQTRLDHVRSLPDGPIMSPSATDMRTENDRLFSDEFREFMPKALDFDSPAARIRQGFLDSGRHIDVARLNEHQRTVGLKRLLGMTGHQIRESDKLGHDSVIRTTDELYELLAYNVADCVGLAQLFAHPVYSGGFDLKAGLLNQYSETRFDRDGVTVRSRRRLRIDTPSAQFVARILAPYKPLDDIPTVSFDYPDAVVAAETGREQVNVLNETERFFKDRVVPGLFDSDGAMTTRPAEASAGALWDRRKHAWEAFEPVLSYYRDIEGSNFNDTLGAARSLHEVPTVANNVPYFAADATPTSCFATFSYGGIHGAEADLAAFEADREDYEDRVRMLRTAREVFPDPADLVRAARNQHNTLTLPDGSVVDKRLVLIGSNPTTVRWRRPKKDDPEQTAQLERARAAFADPADLLATQRPADDALLVWGDPARIKEGVINGRAVLSNTSEKNATYRDHATGSEPVLFTRARTEPSDHSTRLHPLYGYTSAAMVIHEDFSSYYPNLLRNMRAFWNEELGEDRYAAIYEDKQRYGRMLKDPGVGPGEKARLKVLRAGTKLILNSASGAGDMTMGDSPIRMNNRIISMRIIGQLFTWRIAQAQTLSGARIISTNTDGLYAALDPAHGYTEEVNDRILTAESASIGVQIEPEPMYLVSKDSNNRMEIGIGPDRVLHPDSPILSASGGTLACFAGPTPAKSLAHPAVIDAGLATYLRRILADGGEPALVRDFDTDLGLGILTAIRDGDDPLHAAMMFATTLAASVGSITYPFAVTALDAKGRIAGFESLQPVNRVFIVRSGTPGAVQLRNAGAWKVSAASRLKRENGYVVRDDDPDGRVAMQVLRDNGWAFTHRERRANPRLMLVPADQDVTTRRINSIDPSWPMLIRNEDLHAASANELRHLLDSLDLEVYTQMLADVYTRNWINVDV